jgi:hypothetical protein
MEFIAFVVSYGMLARLGVVGSNIELRGDNVASLNWASKERFHSKLGKRAAIAFITLSMALNYSVVSTKHVKGVTNIICDKLSRGTRPSDLGFTNSVCFDVNASPAILNLIRLCNPTLPSTLSLADTASIASDFRICIESIISEKH